MHCRNAGQMSRRAIAVLGAVGLVMAVIVGSVSSAQAWVITPRALHVSAATANTGLGGAVPYVLVQAGGKFTLTVSLVPEGAVFRTDTRLDLTPTLAPMVGGSPHGTFSPSTVTFPADVSSHSYSVSYSAPDNGVVLTASVETARWKTHWVARGSTAPFDVLSTLLRLPKGDPRFTTGVGVGNSSCSRHTTEPECGIIVLPRDIASPKAALSLGKCTANLRCTRGSQVVQFIADLGTRYTPKHPATLIFRCDKRLCPKTYNGIKHFTLKVSQSPTGPLDHVSKPCVAKGIADNGLNNGDTFCTDYVQSHRDKAGDLLLYLLFTRDMRGST
jgi:hypothetical protein